MERFQQARFSKAELEGIAIFIVPARQSGSGQLH